MNDPASAAVDAKEEVKDTESGEVTQAAHPGYYANEVTISKSLLITSAPVADADNLSARSLTVMKTAQGHSVKNTRELTEWRQLCNEHWYCFIYYTVER